MLASRERSWMPFSASLTFLDSDDLHSLIRPAIQAGVMGKFLFMALGANGKARGRDSQLLRPPFVSTGSGYFMFWIWHGLPRFSVCFYSILVSLTLTSSAALAGWQTDFFAPLQYTDTDVHFDLGRRPDRGHGTLRDTTVASASTR